jgi:hypothetical protein
MYPLIPRVPRPRGLGGIAKAAAGLGTWVVDKPWGLSPAIIPGQPQPYQNAIRTILPRAQRPRLLNLHQGPVVPTGTWPVVHPTNAPVFRTPLIAPGERAVSEQLPYAGYGSGWVPLGVAHPPYFLAEKGPMNPGMNGFGETNDDGSTTVNVAGKSVRVSAQAMAQVQANPQVIYQLLTDSAVIYTDLLAQRDIYDSVRVNGTRAYENVMAANLAEVQAMQDATFAAFGDAAQQNEAASRLNQYGAVVTSLSGMMDRGELANMPPQVVQAVNALRKTSTQPDVSGNNTLLSSGPAPTDLGIVFWTAVAIVGVVAILGYTAYKVAPVITDWGVEANRAAAARADADLARARAQSAQWQVYDKQKAALMEKRATVAPAEQVAIDAQIKALDTQYHGVDVGVKRAVRNAGGASFPFVPVAMVVGGVLLAGGWGWLLGLFRGKKKAVTEKQSEKSAYVFEPGRYRPT